MWSSLAAICVINNRTTFCFTSRRAPQGVLADLADLFIARGPPANIRYDKGSEFIATAVQEWLTQVGVTTFYITPASPWKNGYNERFGYARLRLNGSLRDGLVNGDRNRVERMFGKLKQQRRIATRYDKTVLSFESFLNLAAARLW